MHWLLHEDESLVVLGLLPGADGFEPAVGGGPHWTQHHKALAALAAGQWSLERRAWHTNRVLKITPRNGAHSLDLWWRQADDHFHFWYVNMQEPLRRTRFGFDTMDQALDIVIEPDQSWHWKDEDELAEAIELGVFTAEQAAAIRAEGERVAARLPELVPTGWEDWRPDPAWPALSLPEGWDRLA